VLKAGRSNILPQPARASPAARGFAQRLECGAFTAAFLFRPPSPSAANLRVAALKNPGASLFIRG